MGVFSACAGMNRQRIPYRVCRIRVLRVRGDEPPLRADYDLIVMCSPRARG